DYNPCLECKLCVAACPVGAIGADGHFDFSACYYHNYREFMGGFTDWVETIAESKNAVQYRNKVRDKESASMWQSLSFGANYKAAYCLSVCPAGEDVIGPYLNNKREYLETVVKPLQNKREPVYVVPESDAEEHVQKRFPNKTVRRIKGTLRADSIDTLLKSLPLVFQRNQSRGLNAVYHFTFTGKEKRDATVIIRNKTISVKEGHIGKADFSMKADSETWLKFLKKEKSLVIALLSRKIKIKGAPRLLLAFGRCFPS
ncbi:MAG: 4Fe-4S ferredoxin, partial [Calditrichaeota bacterium]